jgi:thiol-disulfide isomerase/thioredoxin
MGIRLVSPASMQHGTVQMSLEPECHITGRITCDELMRADMPIKWTNAYLLVGGQRIGDCNIKPGEFEFYLPPGRYIVNVYGEDLKGRKVDLTVPAGQSEIQLPPIPLTASNLVRLRGKPAPELDGVVGWRGPPVKLADLKGKCVLLDFWGYWCGPCVYAMPTLIELHERYKDKGLAIVGVHCDMGGEIDTPAKLDEKIALLKEKVWKGKDLPFPIALTTKSSSYSEQMYDGTAAAQYGVLHYPTTILIDKDGNVVGEFAARDTKKAIADVEELLAPKR